jgi:protocatechuate 3,4-dioxygenase alpha subunit
MSRKSTAPLANFTVGPFFPPHFVEAGCNDLTRVGEHTAQGQRILLTGRVTDSHNDPAVNVILEIWQADANGIFRHPSDPRSPEADPGFFGWGRSFTDLKGGYRFLTVMPGTYAANNGVPRCPHINVMVLGSGIMRRLVTTVFFGGKGEADDPVLRCVSDATARRRLFAIRDPALDHLGAQAFRFDIVLRGESETPFFFD